MEEWYDTDPALPARERLGLLAALYSLAMRRADVLVVPFAVFEGMRESGQDWLWETVVDCAARLVVLPEDRGRTMCESAPDYRR